MPVRFRCVYCNQLLGISRRKAGTVVRCTNCAGQIVVPDPGAEAENEENKAAASPAKAENGQVGAVFERHDFDELFRPFDFDEAAPSDATPSPVPSSPIEIAARPVSPLVRYEFAHVLIAWAVTILVAFAAGFFAGRG